DGCWEGTVNLPSKKAPFSVSVAAGMGLLLIGASGASADSFTVTGSDSDGPLTLALSKPWRTLAKYTSKLLFFEMEKRFTRLYSGLPFRRPPPRERERARQKSSRNVRHGQAHRAYVPREASEAQQHGNRLGNFGFADRPAPRV